MNLNPRINHKSASIRQVSIPIRDLMNLNQQKYQCMPALEAVSIPIRDLMNLNRLLSVSSDLVSQGFNPY